MNHLHTDGNLLKKLREAAGKPMSSDEIHKQRVSYVMGMLSANSAITRECVEQHLLEREGKKTAA
jgi:hypothetical protein